MKEPSNLNRSQPPNAQNGSGVRQSGLRPFVTGLFPLFLIAHFGYHVVGAMLNPFMPMIRNELHLNYTQTGVLNMTRMPTSESFLVNNIPPHRRSTILGIYYFAGAEMAGVLTSFVGKLVDIGGFDTVFTIAGISLIIVAIVCSILLWRARGSIRASGAI